MVSAFNLESSVPIRPTWGASVMFWLAKHFALTVPLLCRLGTTNPQNINRN